MVEITKNIYWTGYIDWNLRNFHGYLTPYGSTYNAYLLIDDRPAIIDTVKSYGFDEMISRIKEVIDPSKICYIISNHTEMDHSGSIGKLLELAPHAEVICSPQGHQGLLKHFAFGSKTWRFRVVNTGDTLSLGKRTLKFFLTPMVHWPDSMVTYVDKDDAIHTQGILFSNDAFGQHYASYARFADQHLDIVFNEACKYYANIVMPYGLQVAKTLDALKTLLVEMICPSHGLIWRMPNNIAAILNYYNLWAQYKSNKQSAVIIYDTMWHSTEKLALKLLALLEQKNISTRLINLQNTHISDIITQILSAQFVLLGSPILNNKILPTMGAFLIYLSGLKPKNRYGFTFGSYGWSTGGFKFMEDCLKDAGIELISEGKYVNYVPSDMDLNSLEEIVNKISKMSVNEA